MALIFYDNFTGTTIDTGKWAVTDPNSRISQDDALLIANPHTSLIVDFVEYLSSVDSISSGDVVAQCNLDWTTYSSGEAVGGMLLWKDNNNWTRISSRTTAGGLYRIQIIINGSTVYDLQTSITPGKDVKIWTDGTDIKYYYWNGSAWTQIGTTQTYSLGYSVKVFLMTYDNTGFTGANPIIIDNLYFSNADYTTRYPVTANTTNFFPFIN